MTTIKKKIGWEMGHRLAKGYVGKCANLHGHSYVAEIELRSDVLDMTDMVVDFAALGDLKKWIDHNLDHATMLWEGDGVTIDTLASQGHKIFVLSHNPTAEAIAWMLLRELRYSSQLRPYVCAVTVWETASSCACVLVEEDGPDVLGNLVPSLLEGK